VPQEPHVEDRCDSQKFGYIEGDDKKRKSGLVLLEDILRFWHSDSLIARHSSHPMKDSTSWRKRSKRACMAASGDHVSVVLDWSLLGWMQVEDSVSIR
jgi:hypothetical protein